MVVQGPDSVYSWVVVICCSYVHFALFGLFRSSGVVYVGLLQNFEGITREEASWAFALCAAVFQLISPLSSILNHYMSQRKALLFGCAVATLGICSCYFAENVKWIIISYGIIHGIGFGIVVTFVPVIINQYFVKYRATALGIAFSGASISSLLFPVILEWLLQNYTLNDSFLLLSGVTMNTLVASSFLATPPWFKTRPKNAKNEISDKLSIGKDSGVSTSDDVECKKPTDQGNNPTCELVPESNNWVEKGDANEPHSEDSEVDNFLRPENENGPVDFDTLRSNNDSVLFDVPETGKPIVVQKMNCGNLCKDEYEVKEPLVVGKEMLLAKQLEVVFMEPETFRLSISHILKQPMFYLITFTMAVYFLGTHSFFMVIVDFAKDKGIPESKAVYIISMFSVTDLFGRACLGWITDRNFIKKSTMLGMNMTILGILYQIYPAIDSLPAILTVAAIGGLAVGSSVILFFIVQAESLGMKRLTLAIGMTSFINGSLSLLRPGIIGLFRDVLGSYNWMFRFMGFLYLSFSGLWLMKSWQTRNEFRSTGELNSKP